MKNRRLVPSFITLADRDSSRILCPIEKHSGDVAKSELAMGDAVGHQQRQTNPTYDPDTLVKTIIAKSAVQPVCCGHYRSGRAPANNADVPREHPTRTALAYDCAKSTPIVIEEKQKFNPLARTSVARQPNALRSSCDPGSWLYRRKACVDSISRSENARRNLVERQILHYQS